jgi:hypothetical protein
LLPIGNNQMILVSKYGHSLFERDLMLLDVE